jgi:hypothetical protein
MSKWIKRLLIGVLVWVALGALLFGVDIRRVNRGGKKNYDAVRLGMNIRDISIPWRGVLNTIACKSISKDSILIKLEDWPAYSSGRKEIPEACKHMSFFFGGISLQRASYSLEFDEKWNVKHISQLRIGD